MKGDFSRCTHDEAKRYSGVLMQQGRVLVDADWNEQLQIGQHRTETEAIDVIGRCGAPENDAGFGITLHDDSFIIGRGRYYVDGILCENFKETSYTKQEDLPNPPLLQDLLNEANVLAWIVYLHVWKRHITALDDPKIREVALGGPDTCNRVKTIWQVEILPVGMQVRDGHEIDPIGLLTKDCGVQIDEWDELVKESTGMMSARTDPTQAPRPCTLPPTAGYTGLENQLYRVEIHTFPMDGSIDGVAYKWSRENGSVAKSILGINGNEISVSDTGRDRVLGFSNGDWVEISDDERELKEGHGQLVQIGNVNHATRKVTILPPPPGVSLEFNASLHPKMRRWDQKGTSATPDGVKIPPLDEWRYMDDDAKEGGIQIMFPSQSVIGPAPLRARFLRPGDYWLVPARTATGDIEWPEASNGDPVPRMPMGIKHHYCRLGVIYRGRESLEVIDCREIFPPLTRLPHTQQSEEEGTHIVDVQIWRRQTGGLVELKNDDIVSMNDIMQAARDGKPFLQITCDREIDSSTILSHPRDRQLGLSPTCHVTLDIPLLQKFNDKEFIAGYSPIILSAQLQVAGKFISWIPPSAYQEIPKYFTERLLQVQEFAVKPFLLLHLTLKGNFIWSEGTPRSYLDGEVYGVPPEEMPHNLVLPSGDRRRGGDFEMWFWMEINMNLEPDL